jgi:glutamyl-tRNA reductase
MRTTVDIPADIRQKLVTEAARKNMKGYSAIIVKALREYFEKQNAEDAGKEIRKLRGSLSQEDYEKALKILETGRTQWRI